MFSIYNLILESTASIIFLIIFLMCISIYTLGLIISKIVIFYNYKRRFNNFNKNISSFKSMEDYLQSIKNSDVIFEQFLYDSYSESIILSEKYSDKSVVEEYLKVVKEEFLLNVENNLKASVSMLATAGSISPFLGLFGTILGIINTFKSFSLESNITLASIAPGISEALYLTAMGILCAIPSLVAYNFFTSIMYTQLDKLSITLDKYLIAILALIHIKE